jgi:hypothetical protein
MATAVVGIIYSLIASGDYVSGTVHDFNQPSFLIMYSLVAVL